MFFRDIESRFIEYASSTASSVKRGTQRLIEKGYTVLPKDMNLRETAMIAAFDATSTSGFVYGAVLIGKGAAVLASNDFTGITEVFQGGSVLVISGALGFGSLASREIINSRTQKIPV